MFCVLVERVLSVCLRTLRVVLVTCQLREFSGAVRGARYSISLLGSFSGLLDALGGPGYTCALFYSFCATLPSSKLRGKTDHGDLSYYITLMMVSSVVCILQDLARRYEPVSFPCLDASASIVSMFCHSMLQCIRFRSVTLDIEGSGRFFRRSCAKILW